MSSSAPGCVLQKDVRIGADSRLHARVTVCAKTTIGRRCIVHPGAVLGSDGFGFARDGDRWVKVPQLGAVRIGDDVEIGANTTVDCGAIGDTIIEDGVKLDNQIQVGHNVTIGEHTAIAACTGISGSTTIGKRCMIGGMVGFAGHLTIADDVAVTGFSLVSASIDRGRQLFRRHSGRGEPRLAAHRRAYPAFGSVGIPVLRTQIKELR